MKKYLFLLLAFFMLNSVSSAQWIPVGEGSSLGGDIAALLYYNGVIYAGGTAYLFRSSDGGITWSTHLSWPAYAWSLVQSNGNIFCGLSYTLNPGVYISTNNGLNWSMTSLSNKGIISMAASSSQVLAATVSSGIYNTTNNGVNWVQISSNVSGFLTISGNRIYCAMSGLRVTTNNGANWNIIHNEPGISVVADDSLVIFGTQDGNIYRSTNYGQSWTKTYSVPQAYVYSLYKYGSNIFAGTDSGFIVSTNAGLSFFDRNQNLGASRISAIMVLDNYVYVANGNYAAVPVSIWKRLLSDVIGIKPISMEVPETYNLYQNYPNPFNQTSIIRFDVARDSKVELKVFDVMGKEVLTPVNQFLRAGTYEVNFDAGYLPSGIYFYQLKADGYLQTKKMMLVK